MGGFDRPFCIFVFSIRYEGIRIFLKPVKQLFSTILV
jgi:hypothetical protein